MSLIFNALQRFARAESSGLDMQEAKPAKRNTQSLRRCLLSPRVLLTLGAAIVITGLIAVQLVQSLSANARAKASSETPPPAPDERALQVAMQSSVDAGSATGVRASAPAVQPPANNSPADGPPSVASRPEDAQNSARLVFYPPEPDMAGSGETPGGQTAAMPRRPSLPAGRTHRCKKRPRGYRTVWRR